MAYTSAIFHIDFVNGSDAARTALTSCTASNPSGTITRINKTGHGLVTGAVVDLTLFTAWLNSAWKITVVDADNFDLDDAVWQATADTSGTATPRGGMNWADAWLTITAGATTSRHQPGDEIRMAKTADPVSLGQNAQFTNNSQTVTLTTAVTKKLEDAISGWTASANITLGTNTSRKLGATSLQITPGAAFTTGKVAYSAIAGGGTQDFSAHQHISFWIRPTTAAAIAANTYRIGLCSDANGDTIVDAFNIPAIEASTQWQIMNITKIGGGNLGASIQSIAIYALNDPGTTVICINNIFANQGTLNLKTLIGKSGDVNYNIQSIDGVTIKIDSNNAAATGQGYSGTTESVTLHYRVPFDVSLTGNWQTVQESGGSTTPKNHYVGGYNTSNNTIDGLTVVAKTIVGEGVAFSMQQNIKFSNVVVARFSNAFSNMVFCDLDNVVMCGGAFQISAGSAKSGIISNSKFLNNSGAAFLNDCDFINCEFRNMSSPGADLALNNRLYGCTTANNLTAGVSFDQTRRSGRPSAFMRNCTINDSTEVDLTSSNDGWIWSFDHDDTQGNHWGFTFGATANWQTTTLHGSDPGAWKLAVTSASRAQYLPAIILLCEIAVNASSLVTVKVWVKKDHASNIAANIFVEDGATYSIGGISAASTTKANDTSWEELTLTFTPTEAGIVPIYGSAWFVAGSSNVYFGSITVTQA